jgi:hypothetical protein
VTRLNGSPRQFPGLVGGLVQDAEPNLLPLGSIVEGENMVPLPAGLQRTRGGSRILLTLHDDAGSPAELSHTCLVQPFTPVGAIVVGWSDGRNRHYAYRVTADGAFFTGTESTSRHDLSAAPSTSWANATEPARPVAAELFEKLFLADATTDFSSRNQFLSMTSTGTIARPTFVFAGGAAAALQPYCLEEYNGVLFLAGYGDEGDKDRPEILRHSFLAKSPDAADGFDKDAYLLLGAKGQRVTALRKGRGLLLAAKANELYRITGFGRAYPGWQYTVENVQNTLGLGISNPHALTFAEGYWYGMGAQGPLRTDGYVVESLAGPRQRGWLGMNKVESAWVTYHPQRRLILFGVHPTASSPGRSATYPWVLWAWDLERQVWQTDWKFGVDIFMASPVATTTAVGPSAPPSAPNNTNITTTGWTANWTNGDATAETEYWEKLGSGGTWTLITTVAAGTASLARTGRASHQEYFWKVRHRKSGVTTDFTSELSAKTLIAAPSVAPVCTGGQGVRIDVINTNAGLVTLTLESSPAGAGTWTVKQTWTNQGSGTVSSNDLAGPSNPKDYRAKASDAAWPTTDSAYDTITNVSCDEGGPE